MNCSIIHSSFFVNFSHHQLQNGAHLKQMHIIMHYYTYDVYLLIRSGYVNWKAEDDRVNWVTNVQFTQQSMWQNLTRGTVANSSVINLNAAAIVHAWHWSAPSIDDHFTCCSSEA